MPRGSTSTETSRAPNTRKAVGIRATDIGDSDGCKTLHELQQKCLNIFCDALRPDDQRAEIVQEVKGHLYHRDFAAAFGKEEYLQVYAARWSPSRALGYMQVLIDVKDFFSQPGGEVADEPDGLDVLCLGGGAGAELIALAGWTSMMRESEPSFKVRASMLDIAAWEQTISDLHHGIVTAPELSKYASAAAKEANRSLLPENALNIAFQQQDVLTWPDPSLASAVQTTILITLMFTMNELYSTSIARTQHLLATITSAAKPGTSLLVVDSPGSYSTVSINGAEKKYPMQWLLDLTLTETKKWEKVVEDESRWFRLPQGLRYPIELENMRYQIHLYRRVEDG